MIFSGECLRATAATDDLATGLFRVGEATDAFLAVTDGPQDVLWRDGKALRRSPAFPVKAVDTLGAGDVFHGAFALALAEGRDAVGCHAFCRGGGGAQMHAASAVRPAPRPAPRSRPSWRASPNARGRGT